MSIGFKDYKKEKDIFFKISFGGDPPIHGYYGDKTIDLLDVKNSHLVIYINGSKQSFELAPGCKKQEEKISKINRMMNASRKATIFKIFFSSQL